MSEKLHALYARIEGQVQFGPVYRCWICGEPAARLVPFHEWCRGPTLLDRYADHLAYLDRRCRDKGDHPCRVVVVGPAVTPVNWPDSAPLEERFAAIEEAMALLADELQARRAGGDGKRFDPALALALRLRSGILTPAQGAQEIHDLVALTAAG